MNFLDLLNTLLGFTYAENPDLYLALAPVIVVTLNIITWCAFSFLKSLTRYD